MKGVLDRFEDGGVAVILAEEAGREFYVPLRYLPEGSKQGMWFTLTLEKGHIVNIEVDLEKSTAQLEKTEQLLERLRHKKSGSRFKRH